MTTVYGGHDVFYASLSHEFRTPLTVIKSVAELLNTGLGPEDDAYNELVGRLGNSAERLAALVEDLLDLDRLERGVLRTRRQPTCLTTVLRSVVDAVDTSGHRVVVDDEPVVASVDRAQAARMCEHLVTNAVRHTPPGTRVWARAQAFGPDAVIVVEDAGPGLAPHIKRSAFDPFVRTEELHVAGTGTGLALVDRFARLHGGRAWVDDRPGGGASFKVWLPSGAPLRRAVAAAGATSELATSAEAA